MKILIVHDDIAVRQPFIKYLSENKGHDVDGVDNMNQIHLLLCTTIYDRALIQLGFESTMTGGIQIARELRALMPSLHICIITGQAPDDEVLEEMKKAGIAEIIYTPFHPSKLDTALKL